MASLEERVQRRLLGTSFSTEKVTQSDSTKSITRPGVRRDTKGEPVCNRTHIRGEHHKALF